MTQLRFGIKAVHWDKILDLLQANGKVTDILLFGSRAKGNFKPSSDIDLCRIGNQLDEHELLKLKTSVDSLDLPWEIDLIVFDLLSDEAVKEHIQRGGISMIN